LRSERGRLSPTPFRRINSIALCAGGSDYFMEPQLLTFNDSITTNQVSPAIIADDVVEDEESFGLNVEVVGSTVNVQTTQNEAIVRIVDINCEQLLLALALTYAQNSRKVLSAWFLSSDNFLTQLS
jgi:hypothetical protein